MSAVPKHIFSRPSSLRIYALDLTFNRIFSASWKPVLDVVERLFKHVDYLQLGGSYLPALTAELTKLQASGYVSLALPITGSPVNQWQKKWDDIATEFGSKAYDPDTLQLNPASLWSKHLLVLLLHTPSLELVRTADAVGGLASQCAACTPHSQEDVDRA
ncbi:hypothetical protein WJX79_008519 [Trebouxia sp. C0005]